MVGKRPKYAYILKPKHPDETVYICYKAKSAVKRIEAINDYSSKVISEYADDSLQPNKNFIRIEVPDYIKYAKSVDNFGFERIQFIDKVFVKDCNPCIVYLAAEGRGFNVDSRLTRLYKTKKNMDINYITRIFLGKITLSGKGRTRWN